MVRDIRFEYRLNWRREFTPAIRWLIVANCAVFAVMKIAALITDGSSDAWFLGWFGLIPVWVVTRLRVWTLFTYLFLHAGVFHLIINMLVLWMFGRMLEPVWGVRRFLNYYFLTGVGAGVCVVLVNLLPRLWGHPQRESVTVGASGALFGILMACALLFPEREVWLFPLPVFLSMRMFVLLWGAIAFFSSLEASGDGISHIAHLGGLVVGYVYIRRGSYFYTARNLLTDWRQRRLRRKFEVYMRDHRNDPPSTPRRWMN
ncbi:MAG TPA: rhomboid family intramembrane serine protease [Candidatus Acidoferrales bacterium]|nr:rhomboid family intramembrane serine protease [Candidatus Acidoferrales bacterium]